MKEQALVSRIIPFLFLFVFAAMTLSASTTSAQTVAMAGQYSERNGIIINIPQNPPNLACSNSAAPGGGDARCIGGRQQFFGATPGPLSYQYPRVGNIGARNVVPAGAGTGTTGNPTGLNVGDPFLMPPFFFNQRYNKQVGIVLNNITVQLDTSFTAAAPKTSRTLNPPALTRQFSAMNWSAPGNGQNDGGGVARAAATTTITRLIPNETLTMMYVAGPRQFGGTATILLDGGGTLYIGGPQLNGAFPTFLRPVAGTNPLGDLVVGFRTRNAAGWDYTVMGGQIAGRIKSFAATPTAVGPDCGPLPPPSPPGCNEINGFETRGVTVQTLPTATATKHMFAWTTGTVSIVRTAVRRGVTQTDTLTGMGYDYTTTSTLGGPQRNVGLVAGSYSVRTTSGPTPSTEMNSQLVGMSLKFTPEPNATIALMSGLGLLGVLGARRRRR